MSHSEALVQELEAKAKVLVNDCLDQFCTFSQGHVGGTMSVMEIITALYFHHLKFDPKNPDWPERDRVIMSKAHCCEAIYAALVELGMYPEETLGTYYCYGSPLPRHPPRAGPPGASLSRGRRGSAL